MIKVKALFSLEHYGRRDRGAEFEVSDQHAALLVKRGLAVVLGGVTQRDEVGVVGKAGAVLVDQNAADVLSALAGITDAQLLRKALEAEHAKGDKARKTVLEALTSAIDTLPKE